MTPKRVAKYVAGISLGAVGSLAAVALVIGALLGVGTLVILAVDAVEWIAASLGTDVRTITPLLAFMALGGTIGFMLVRDSES